MQVPDIQDGTIWAWAAGLVGAAVSLRTLPGKTRTQKLGYLAAGFATSVIMTQPIVDVVALPGSWQSGIGFLVGAFGITTIDALISMIQKADLWALVSDIARRFIGRS